jgi:hypothetical protein
MQILKVFEDDMLIGTPDKADGYVSPEELEEFRAVCRKHFKRTFYTSQCDYPRKFPRTDWLGWFFGWTEEKMVIARIDAVSPEWGQYAPKHV